MTQVLRRIRSEAELDQAIAEAVAVLYKHSPWCGLSSGAMVEVQQFAARHPDVPVYLIDVVGDRPLSRLAAEKLSIEHESPQVILLEQGAPVWDASHFRVSCDRLEQALAQRGVPSSDA